MTKKKKNSKLEKSKYSNQYRICINCKRILLLNEEYFYKDRKGVDGYKRRCKKCQSSVDLKSYHDKVKRIKKSGIYNINGKGKVPSLSKYKVSKHEEILWKNDPDLICVLRCRWCAKTHKIKNLNRYYNCSCKHNLIYEFSVNYLWASILYTNKSVRDGHILTFNRWK